MSSRALLGARCKSPAQMLEWMHKHVLARFRDPVALPALSQQMWERRRPEQDAGDSDLIVVAVS